MTARPDHDAVLPEEDDWFTAPSDEPVASGEVAWEDDWAPLPRARENGLAQRQIAVVVAVAVVIALGGAGVLIARALSGSDAPPSVAPTTQLPTTPTATTPAATTPTPTTPTVAPVATVPTDAVLRSGSSGAGVTALQGALARLGFAPGAADGKFGPATVAAVTAFQTANKLTGDGIAGANTIAAINAALASG